MSDPYLGEIKVFAFSFAPRGWSQCNGATVALRQSTALYALIGTQFGGDGVTTFQLPNLAGRLMAGSGQGPNLTPRQIGNPFGTDAVTLEAPEMPPHLHTYPAYFGRGVRAALPTATSAVGQFAVATAYTATAPDTTMDPQAVSIAGQNQPHGNLQPMLGMIPSIAMVGVFPSFD